jgi:hypothetical protein
LCPDCIPEPVAAASRGSRLVLAFMRTLLCVFLLAFCCGCQDKAARREQFDTKYVELGHIYLTGDLQSADQALAGLERLVSTEGRPFFTPKGLPMELAFLRARRSQITERLGDHARAQQLISEALVLAHQAGKNTNGGPAELLAVIDKLDEKRAMRWKQNTN